MMSTLFSRIDAVSRSLRGNACESHLLRHRLMITLLPRLCCNLSASLDNSNPLALSCPQISTRSGQQSTPARVRRHSPLAPTSGKSSTCQAVLVPRCLLLSLPLFDFMLHQPSPPPSPPPGPIAPAVAAALCSPLPGPLAPALTAIRPARTRPRRRARRLLAH
jgi:hypothetical protein